MGRDSSTRASFAAGHFEFVIDGHPSIAFLKNIDGGWASAALIEEAIGGDLHKIQSTGPADIDPFTIEFGLAGALPVLKWIQDSWTKNWNRRNGQITHANFDLFAVFEHHFYDALVEETTFPALDGGSNEAAYLKVKIQPERVLTKPTDQPTQRVSQQSTATKQKMWLANSFRFTIDGMDDMQYTNKIESFTIKQGVKKTWTGVDRFPTLTPTSVKFPNISGTISAAYAKQLLEWHHKSVVKGAKDPSVQKSGSLEFLTPDKKTTAFRINMYHIGIVKAGMQQSTANQDQIKRVKFELHVGRMELDGHGELGFE
jgi:T4-like virus tail tube protein gp19